MTTWEAITKRSLAEIDDADPLYRPTNFWQPGLHQLLSDMDELGLERFKSWPSAAYWFYPTYAANVRPETVGRRRRPRRRGAAGGAPAVAA